MIALIELLAGSKVARWIAEVLAVVALFACAAVYLEHRGAERSMTELQASSKKLLDTADAAVAEQSARHDADVKANQEKTDAALAANTALSARLADSVRDFDAYRRAHPDVPRSTGGPATAVAGECGARSCGDLAQELAVRGNELAGSVGELSATLSSCQRDRDALTGLPR